MRKINERRNFGAYGNYHLTVRDGYFNQRTKRSLKRKKDET